MPLIRCQSCGQGYDIPPAIAVRLPTSVAVCSCGESLSGARAALLAKLMNPEDVTEIDLLPFQTAALPPRASSAPAAEEDPFDTGSPQSIRVSARGSGQSIRTIFSIDEHPLWIGKSGCHIELDDPDLSIQHCSIFRKQNELFVRDAESHTGTYLDGEAIDESPLSEGVHLIRVGATLVCVERTTEPGEPVVPVQASPQGALDGSSLLMKKLQERNSRTVAALQPRKLVLRCVDGPGAGLTFDLPADGAIIGREGSIRVPDEFLSRKHFELVPDPQGGIRVRDLGSRNGTFLNTLPARDTRVRSGDEIQAGTTRFRLEEQ